MIDEKKEGSSKEEEGVSLRDIFRIIGKRIWYVLGGTLLITLVAVLIFMLAINPGMRSDSMTFQIDYPKYSEGKYPDGSVIDYHDMISEKVIEAAKNDPEYKDEFASIDAKSVTHNKGIKISAQKSSANDPYRYTITLKKSYFKGVDTQNFIKALTEAFISSVIVEKKVVDSFNFELDPTLFAAATYKNQLTLLNEQKATILEEYDSWIQTYSAGRLVNGKSLGAYRADVTAMLSDDTALLETYLIANGYEYFNKNVTAQEVEDCIERLYAEWELDLAILDELKGCTDTASSASTYAASVTGGLDDVSGGVVIVPGDADLSQKMAYYSERIATIELQISYLESKSSAEMADEIASFGEEYLSTQLENLNAKADVLKSVIGAIYSMDTAVIFSSQTVSSTGGISLLLVGVGVCVVAFLVLCALAYVRGKKRIAEQKEPTPIAADQDDKSE